MAKLTWTELMFTVPHRFSLQRSDVRGEGVCYSIMGMDDPEDMATYKAMDNVPGAWWGPGSLTAAKAACQRIADATDRRLGR